MKFESTSGTYNNTDLRRAFLGPEPEDGSLFVPQWIPRIPPAFFNNISEMSLADIAYVVARQLTGPDVDADVLKRVCYSTFHFPVPLVDAGEVKLLQLWHGPTGSYNDIGALFVRALLDWQQVGKVNLIMATLGDSGAAMANAMANRPDTRLTILYPRNHVSRLLQAQICSKGDNIRPIAVEGSIDSCRELVSRALYDTELNERMVMTSGTSQSLARFLPHVFYYFHAYSLMRAGGEKRPITVALPGGNLANLAAGILAKQMGVPIKRFIVGCNTNNGLKYMLRGEGVPAGPTIETIAPAIDVGRPSNIPRLKYLYRDHPRDISKEIVTRSSTDEEIKQMLLEMHSSGNTVDSATAAALCAVRALATPDESVVTLATADPRKEAEQFKKLGIEITPPVIEAARVPERMRPGYRELRKRLLDNI